MTDKPRPLKSATAQAFKDLKDLWDIPPGVDEALFAASQAQDPTVAENHLAEARDLLEDEDG